LVGGPYRLPARRKSQFESRWDKTFVEFSEKFGEGFLEYAVYGLVWRASSIFQMQHLDAIYRDLTSHTKGTLLIHKLLSTDLPDGQGDLSP
jgi:hypothetical protein